MAARVWFVVCLAQAVVGDGVSLPSRYTGSLTATGVRALSHCLRCVALSAHLQLSFAVASLLRSVSRRVGRGAPTTGRGRGAGGRRDARGQVGALPQRAVASLTHVTLQFV